MLRKRALRTRPDEIDDALSIRTMSELRRPASLGNLAFGLAIASVLAIAAIFALTFIADIAFGRHQQPLAFIVLFAAAVFAMPALAIAAIVSGHIARHRDRQDRNARLGLVIGYGMLAFVALLAVVSALTFISIRTPA